VLIFIQLQLKCVHHLSIFLAHIYKVLSDSHGVPGQVDIIYLLPCTKSLQLGRESPKFSDLTPDFQGPLGLSFLICKMVRAHRQEFGLAF
jgi:hypothetical protein